MKNFNYHKNPLCSMSAATRGYLFLTYGTELF